jgi:hypothetical protein
LNPGGGNLPELPLAHLTIARHLQTIIASLGLVPSYCAVFDRAYLYFSYGAPYYRPANRQTQDALELPISFVFSPELLSTIERAYPFDTGAVAGGLCGDDWRGRLSLDELYVTCSPRSLVHAFYGSNDAYLKGRPRRTPVPAVEPVLLVSRFLLEDLSWLGVDQRQRTIECIAGAGISLLDHLKLIAYPSIYTPQIAELWRAVPRKFDWIAYEADVNENPSSLVTHMSKLIRQRLGYLFNSPNGSHTR